MYLMEKLSIHDISLHIMFDKTRIYTKSIKKNKRHKLLYVLFNIVLAFNVMVIFLTNNHIRYTLLYISYHNNVNVELVTFG